MHKKLNANVSKLLYLLSDGEYHDGSTIGLKLGMTRSAVWKLIKKLQAYDVEIDSIKGKGYALLQPLMLLDVKKIKKQLRHDKIDMLVFESIPSTNDYLKSFKQVKQIKICLAEQQTQGKGRLNRTWFSPFGKNVYLSCLYPFQKDISELAGLSLVTSLAILKTLKTLGIQQSIAVKWPNDIMYNQQKIAGNLIEIQAESHGMCHAVIGIGINVNMLAANISQAWTSTQHILGEYLDRNIVVSTLINYLLDDLQIFSVQGFQAFVDEWIRTDSLTNKQIMLKNMNTNVAGLVAGVNEQGHLLLRLPNGMMQAFSAGDTSILKN